MLYVIIDTAKQDVLEGQPLAIAEREVAQSRDQLFDGPLPGDGHDLCAQRFAGRVQRHGQFGPNRLSSEIRDARHDARSRHGHARLRNANALRQQPHRLHKVVVVQKGFALSHENEIDAVALRLDLLGAEHSQDLAHDFAGGQVAMQAQKSSHAEGALDGAAYLAGDADRGPLPASSIWRRLRGGNIFIPLFRQRRAKEWGTHSVAISRRSFDFAPKGRSPRDNRIDWVELFQLLVAAFRAVAGLAAIAFGHPDGLDTLAVGERQQVAHGAIGGDKFLLDTRQADHESRRAQSLAEGLRQDGKAFHLWPPLPVQTVK